MRTLAQFLSLYVLYVLLSGQIESVKLLGLGAVGCAGITLLLRRLGLVDAETLPLRSMWRMLPYVPWLALQVLKANVDVARRVWSPRLRISPRMIRLEHSLTDPVAVATLANSITLTPGTVTAEVEPDAMQVHALSREAAEDLMRSTMRARVARIEGRGR